MNLLLLARHNQSESALSICEAAFGHFQIGYYTRDNSRRSVISLQKKSDLDWAVGRSIAHTACPGKRVSKDLYRWTSSSNRASINLKELSLMFDAVSSSL